MKTLIHSVCLLLAIIGHHQTVNNGSHDLNSAGNPQISLTVVENRLA